MKNLGFKKKNLIALALVMVLAASCFGAYRTQAAGLIDESKQCTLTVKAHQEANETNPFSDYKGYVTVRLYKIADVDNTGKYTNIREGIDLSKLEASNVSAETLNEVSESAYKSFNLDQEQSEHPTLSISFDLSAKSTAISNIDRGLYLFVPQPTNDEYYDYTFKYSLVSVPTSKYITATKVDADGNTISDDSQSDEWQYDVEVLLKAEAKERYGNLKITKTLSKYNRSLGNASFVFEVTATDRLDSSKTVFSNVYTMNFDKPGDNTITVEHIPAGANATVKEVYSGASYQIGAKDTDIKETVISADEVKEVKFTNDYDEELQVGGISVENQFKYDEVGNINWIDSEGNEVMQKQSEIQESNEGGN